jgi:hypothetical protein
MSVTKQVSSSLVAMFLMRGFWPINTFSRAEQRVVRVHNLRLGLFREDSAIRTLSGNHHRDTQQDALAATLPRVRLGL